MEKYTVTISRQFGSLGRTIAEKMSENLGIPFYDRDIVEETSKRLGLPVPEVSETEEKALPLFSNRRYPLGMGLISVRQEIFSVQSNIIRDLAEKSSCIIVGRCADSVLKDFERCLNIYIYAPYEARIKNCMELYEMEQHVAQQMIREVDRARELYRIRCGDDIRSAFDYRHLMVDSSKFGPDKTAKLLSDVVRDVFGDDGE